MKIYDREKVNKLYEYKESLEDEEIKEIISDLIKKYNIMYIKYRDYIKDRQNRKGMYEQIEQLSVENVKLKEKNDTKTIIIKSLREELSKRKGK